MARAKKVATQQWGLRVQHTTVFRRTVNIGTKVNPEMVQLVFNPDTPYDLTAKEIEGLQADIDNGIIVPWANGDRRMRPVASPTQDAATLEALQAENAALKAEVEELTAQLADATAPDDASELDAADDVPLGDE